MSTYLICHDARQTEGAEARGREMLGRRIADLWASQLALHGVWIVHANATSDEIRDQLIDVVPAGDVLIVVGAGSDSAWTGLAPAETEWLIDHI